VESVFRTIAIDALDWMGARVGAGTLADHHAGIWAWSKTWDRAQTNDLLIWSDEPQIDRVKQTDAQMRIDPTSAFPTCLNLAELGSIICMNWVAYCYGGGIAIPEAILYNPYQSVINGTEKL
jgi:hypothetical protein